MTTTHLRHRPSVPNLTRLLHQIDVQPAADMPSDMAMEGPHARIIGVVLDDEEAVRLHDLHVAALRVGEVCDFAVPGSLALWYGQP